MNTVNVSQLYLYPVKSLRGIAVDQWPLTPQGLLHDRQWMLVMPNGRFVSQRQLTQMALIDVYIEDQLLVLSKSGHGSVSLKLPCTGVGETLKAKVWNDECNVRESHNEASSWLNQVLKPPQPLKLVNLAHNQQRPQSEPERFGHQTRIKFADAAPYLISNEQSIKELNNILSQKGKARVDNRHFRPNIVIDGLDAFQEHQVQTLYPAGKQYELKLIDHCERCIITTINPDSGEKNSSLEPLKTLTDINPMPNKAHAAAFGVNAVIDLQQEQHSISVGDRLIYQ